MISLNCYFIIFVIIKSIIEVMVKCLNCFVAIKYLDFSYFFNHCCLRKKLTKYHEIQMLQV